MSLLFALAFPVFAADAAPSEASETVADAVPATRSVDDLIDEAIRVRQHGDPDAARALLVVLEPMVPAETKGWYLYQRGICEELDWQPAAALAFYDQVIALGGDAALDAHFRRTLVLEDMGQDKAALEGIIALDRAKGMSQDDELTVEFQRGISEIATGRTARGIRHVQQALDATEGGDTHRYLRAKARNALVDALLDEADALPLTGREKRVVRNLKARAERIQAAEKQIIALAALQEPEWVLASLIRYGDGFASLADALEAAPVPAKLNEAEVAIYQKEIAQKVANVRTKSFHAYDQGVAVATRIGWESPRVATLKARRDALAAVR